MCAGKGQPSFEPAVPAHLRPLPAAPRPLLPLTVLPLPLQFPPGPAVACSGRQEEAGGEACLFREVLPKPAQPLHALSRRWAGRLMASIACALLLHSHGSGITCHALSPCWSGVRSRGRAPGREDSVGRQGKGGVECYLTVGGPAAQPSSGQMVPCTSWMARSLMSGPAATGMGEPLSVCAWPCLTCASSSIPCTRACRRLGPTTSRRRAPSGTAKQAWRTTMRRPP